MNICSCIVFISCGAPVQLRLRSREASPKLIKSFDVPGAVQENSSSESDGSPVRGSAATALVGALKGL